MTYDLDQLIRAFLVLRLLLPPPLLVPLLLLLLVQWFVVSFRKLYMFFLLWRFLFPTLGVGLLDFKVSYYSSPAETTSWSAQLHRLP